MTVTPASNPPLLNRAGIWIGYALGAIALPGCFVIATQMGAERWFNILLCVFGSIAGWSAGMLISPHAVERRQFSEFRKAISAFITGFVLAKFDTLLPAGGNVANVTLLIGRVLLFATTFLLCLQFTYVARSYLKSIEPDQT
jgi:hypothetical protein